MAREGAQRVSAARDRRRRKSTPKPFYSCSSVAGRWSTRKRLNGQVSYIVPPRRWGRSAAVRYEEVLAALLLLLGGLFSQLLGRSFFLSSLLRGSFLLSRSLLCSLGRF